MMSRPLATARKLLNAEWQSAALLCLSDQGPLHYAELAQAIIRYMGRPPSEGHLTRVLKRLTRDGLITAESDIDHHKLYALNPSGEARVRTLKAIANAVAQSTDTDTSEVDPSGEAADEQNEAR